MALPAISDLTIRSIEQAMRGLSVQRKAIQDNIVNAETPGFLANETSFEDSLAEAISSGSPGDMTVTTARSTAPTNMNGNNVAVDTEFVNLTQNSLAQQLAVEALNAKYRLLRTAITGA